jgi:hypothetical protein
MAQIMSVMPKGANFKTMSPENKLMVEDYLRTGDQTTLMNIDFGIGAKAGVKAVSTFGKQATDLGFTPGTPEFTETVKKLMDDSKKKGPLVTVNVGEGQTEAQKALAKANVARLNELQAGKGSRNLNLSKAQEFLSAFTDGRAQSGVTRKALSFIPGVFTSQSQFDEELDSFSELAARAKLKAVGEIRPTDADVKGMKAALFGIGKDEETNMRLLQDYIQEQQALEDEFTGLVSANEAGNISNFQGVAGTMSPRENNPAEITGWFAGISPDTQLFDDVYNRMTPAQQEIFFQEIQAGRF